LTFVCEWPSFSIAHSQVEMDAGAILAASMRAVTLWPEPGESAYRSRLSVAFGTEPEDRSPQQGDR
jgi:hypothetical protein